MKSFIFLLVFATAAQAQLATNSANANLYADAFAGSDIGVKINAAFASAGGTSVAAVQGVVVNLNPNTTYSYSTDIVIPNNLSAPYISAPVLDCHGSVLNWTGAATDQVTVMEQNGYGTGEIRNCFFSDISESQSTITFYSRINFKVTHSQFYGVPIFMINDTDGGGPGYTEQQHWDDIELIPPNATCAITFEEAADLTTGGSFFYNWFSRIHLGLNGTANGFCLATNTSGSLQPWIIGGNFDLHVNTGGTGNAVLYLGNGTTVSRGFVTITGENDGGTAPYDVYANAGSAFYNFGSSYATGLSHGFAAGVPISSITFMGGPEPISNSLTGGSPLYASTKTLSGEPGGTAAFRQCENEQVGNTTAFLLAQNGGVEMDCAWEIAYRVTDYTNQDVDNQGTSSNPITTKMWVGSLGGVGFGPNLSGSNYALSTAEVQGTLGVRYPGLGSTSNGTSMVRLISSDGNMADQFTGGSASGQPSYHYSQYFYDTYSLYTDVLGLDCYSRGAVYCSIPNLATGTSSNSDFAGQLTLSSGTATYSFTGLYTNPPVCTATDTTSVAATQVVVTASTLTVNGSGTDVVNYVCIGRT